MGRTGPRVQPKPDAKTYAAMPWATALTKAAHSASPGDTAIVDCVELQCLTKHHQPAAVEFRARARADQTDSEHARVFFRSASWPPPLAYDHSNRGNSKRHRATRFS